jgi:hypothetical protein
MWDLYIFKIKEVRINLVLSAFIALALWYFMLQSNKLDIIYKNYGDFASLSATLLGFIITSFTILITFPGNYKIQFMKKHKIYPMLFSMFLLTIYLLLILFILSLLGLLVAISNYIYIFSIIYLLVLSIMCFITAIWILKELTNLYLSN